MTTRISDRRRESSSGSPNRAWATLVDDFAGTDGDIERLVGTYCIALHCTPKKACAALISKLSSLDLGGGARQLEEVC